MPHAIKDQFAETRLAIINTLSNPELQKLMNGFGFNQKRMQEGNNLLEQCRLLDAVQEEKYGAYYANTDAFYEEMEQVKKQYRRHRKIAAVAYEGNRAMILKLKLKEQGSTITDFMDRVEAFYQVLSKDNRGMAAYGISNEEVAQSQAMVQSLIEIRTRQIASKGEAQHSTQQRNQTLKELNAWMSDFRYMARFALRDEPQLLETLGIAAPSRS